MQVATPRHGRAFELMLAVPLLLYLLLIVALVLSLFLSIGWGDVRAPDRFEAARIAGLAHVRVPRRRPFVPPAVPAPMPGMGALPR